jgi:hypothetical protein
MTHNPACRLTFAQDAWTCHSGLFVSAACQGLNTLRTNAADFLLQLARSITLSTASQATLQTVGDESQS